MANKIKKYNVGGFGSGAMPPGTVAMNTPPPTTPTLGAGTMGPPAPPTVTNNPSMLKEGGNRPYEELGKEMYDKMSFDEAFAHARKRGATTFEWRGNSYHTMTKEEVEGKEGKKQGKDMKEILRGYRGNTPPKDPMLTEEMRKKIINEPWVEPPIENI